MNAQRWIAMAISLALTAAACSTSDDEPATTTPVTTSASPTTAQETTSTAPTTTVASAISDQDALTVADAYFEAYNAGDVKARFALFTADATFSNNFGSVTRTDTEQLAIWNAAQGTRLSPPDCTATTGELGSVIVSCTHGNSDAVVQAVDGPPVPITLTLTVTSSGITREVLIFGDPDFNVVGVPFSLWMGAYHPQDADGVGFGNWTTVAEAERNGTLLAQYATEWAIFFEANNCRFDNGRVISNLGEIEVFGCREQTEE